MAKKLQFAQHNGMKKFFATLFIVIAAACNFSFSLPAKEKGEEAAVQFVCGDKVLLTARASLAPLPSKFAVDGTGYAGYFYELKKSRGEKAALFEISPTLFGAISSLSETYRVLPEDAEVTFSAGGFEYKTASPGYAVDEEKTINRLFLSLNGKYTTVNVAFRQVEADVQIEDLKAINVLRSSFSTKVTGSQSRRFNVKLAAERISGATVMPGETFSFNETVGKRTLQNGFKEAVVISYGEYAKGVGGGVCQVSTTLYNAVLVAGLTVLRAVPHSLRPSYVAAGFDAMVSDYTDFVFRNDLEHPVYLSAGFDGKNVWVKIYGQKSEYSCVKRISKTIEEIPYKTVYVEGGGAGCEKVLFPGRNGLKTESYLQYEKDGKTYVVKIRTSVYRAEDRKIAKASDIEIDKTA